MRSRTSRAVARASGLAAGVLLAVALSATGAPLPVASLASGTAGAAGASVSAKRGCALAAAAAPVTLRLRMLKVPGGRVPATAVCIDGKGPYRFLVSTGTGSSVVTPALVHRLRLKKGDSASIRGVTCVDSAPTVAVTSWSMSGLKLAPQSLVVAKLPRAGSSAVQGIIGSDVLERFGAVRIDFQRGRLKLRSAEGAATKGNVYILGKAATTPPPSLATGRLELSAALRVFVSPHGTIVAAPAKLAGHTAQLAVDSGSASSALLPSIARSLKLKAAGATRALSGLGCRGKGRTYTSGAWSLGGTSLRKGPIVARRLVGTANGGLQGVLGTDVLGAKGSAVVDYADAHLWLISG